MVRNMPDHTLVLHNTNVFSLSFCAIPAGVVTNMSQERIDAVVAPKTGAVSLLRIAVEQRWQTEWIIAFSSTTSLLGYPGQSNYAAANTIMDHMAQHGAQSFLRPATSETSAPPRVIALNWGPWAEVGMAREGTKAYKMAVRSGELPLPTAKSFDAMERALAIALLSGRSATTCAQFAICKMVWGRTVWRDGTIAANARTLDAALKEEERKNGGRMMMTTKKKKKQTKTKRKKKRTGKKKGGGGSKSAVAQFLESRVSMWAPGETLSALGLDSLDEVQLRGDFQRNWPNTPVSLSIFSVPNQTLGELATALEALVVAAKKTAAT